MMFDENTFKRFPRHDNDFILSDDKDKSLWFENTDTASWVETAICLLWIAGILALVIYTCSHSPICPLYKWLYKLRPEPRHAFVERWVVNQGGPQARDSHQMSSAPLLDESPPSSLRFSDPPPDYSQVVAPPPYDSVNCSIPQEKQIDIVIPDREWTRRTEGDERGTNN